MSEHSSIEWTDATWTRPPRPAAAVPPMHCGTARWTVERHGTLTDWVSTLWLGSNVYCDRTTFTIVRV